MSRNVSLTPVVAARREQFERLLADLKFLPTSHVVPMRVLELKRQPSAGAADFARVLLLEPALSAKVLALANSSAYSPVMPVTRLTTAISMIGLNNLLPLIFGLSFSGIFNRFGMSPDDQGGIWRASLLKAVTARQIILKDQTTPFANPAEREAVAEEGFLAAIFQDVALPIFYAADRSLWPEFVAILDSTPEYRLEREMRHYGITHADAASRCASMLGLPDLFVESAREHHSGLTALATRSPALANALNVAAELPHRITAVSPKILQHLASAVNSQTSTDSAVLTDLIRCVTDSYRETTALFGPPDDASASFKQFLQNLSIEVVDCLQSAINSSTTEINSLKERERKMQSTVASLQDMAAQAEHDPLTGALVRPAFMGHLKTLLELAATHKADCVVGFLDMDDFKKINDGYGHATGDRALVELVKRMSTFLKGRGIIGRIGGDEFVFAFVAQPAQMDADITSMREVVAQYDVRHNDGTLQLTTSVGMVRTDNVTRHFDGDTLVQRADAVMYQVKRGGKANLSVVSASAQTNTIARPGEPIAAGSRTTDNSPAQTFVPTPTGEPVTDDMVLAAEQFELIRAELKSQGAIQGKGTQADRRRAPRGGLRVAVTALPCAAGRTYNPRKIWVRDISSGGIGLISPEPMESGIHLLITLPRKGGKRLNVLYLVVRCSPVGQGQFAIGAKIIRTVDGELPASTAA